MKEKFFLVSLGRGFELRWSRRSNSLGVKPPGPVVLAGGTSAHVASHCMGEGRSQVSGPTTPGPAICLHLPPPPDLELERETHKHQPCSCLLPCMLITSCHHQSFGKGGGISTHDMARPRKEVFQEKNQGQGRVCSKNSTCWLSRESGAACCSWDGLEFDGSHFWQGGFGVFLPKDPSTHGAFTYRKFRVALGWHLSVL